MPLVVREGIELAKVGTWNTSTGVWNCNRTQIADAVRAGKSGKFRNGILKRGHTDPRFAGDTVIAEDGEPALGVVRNLRATEDGETLLGDALVPDWLDDELDAIYPSRSVEADLGVETPDGDKYAMVLTGVSLLGVTKPAIQSLAELPERVAASEYTSAVSIAAGFFDEAKHPRGGKGTSAGGKFVAKGSGYGNQKGGQGHGEEADTVRAVQEELIRLGLLSKDSGKNAGKDGLFGPKTEAAVKKWQHMHGHEETGHVTQALLRTLKAAKSANPAADKRAKKKPVAPKAPHLLTHRSARVKAAAEEEAPEGLAVREITSDTVVYDDAVGRVWVAPWDDNEDTVTIGETAPAVVAYMPIAASEGGMAAHSMHVPLYSGRGWEPSNIITASQGDTELDITPLREALGLDATADEDAVMKAALAKVQTPVETPTPAITQETAPVDPVASPAAQNDPSNEADAPSVETVEALVAAKVAAALAPIQANHTLYEAKIADLSGWKAERLAQEVVTTKTAVISAAAQQGKFAPAERATWEAEYDKAPDTVTRILASMKPGTAVPVTASGYAGDGTEARDDFAGFEAAFGWEEAK